MHFHTLCRLPVLRYIQCKHRLPAASVKLRNWHLAFPVSFPRKLILCQSFLADQPRKKELDKHGNLMYHNYRCEGNPPDREGAPCNGKRPSVRLDASSSGWDLCGRGGMADAPDLGSGALRRKSSSLFVRTIAFQGSKVERAVVAQW